MQKSQNFIGVKIRTVNTIANNLQAKGICPYLVKDLHADVLVAIKNKKDVVLIDYDRWQLAKNANNNA